MAAREGLPVDHALVTALRDVAGRIAELIDLFAQADNILDETLLQTIARAELAPDPQAEEVE